MTAASPNLQPTKKGDTVEGLTFIQCGDSGDCDHDFSGWREFEDGRGGEQFCQKCGLGAMQWSMRFLP